jgi:hypothetical protein
MSPQKMSHQSNAGILLGWNLNERTIGHLMRIFDTGKQHKFNALNSTLVTVAEQAQVSPQLWKISGKGQTRVAY